MLSKIQRNLIINPITNDNIHKDPLTIEAPDLASTVSVLAGGSGHHSCVTTTFPMVSSFVGSVFQEDVGVSVFAGLT